MIPYFEQPSLPIGPLTIHAFGALVAGAVLLGLEVGRRRFARLGVNAAAGERFGWYVVGGGFLGAHLFSLVFYFPEQLRADPLAVFRIWENLSSFGAILGGLAGGALFFRGMGRRMTARDRWQYLDVLAFVFALSLAVGRIACTLAHDHPGTITTWPIGVSLASADAQAYIQNVYAGAGQLAALPANLGAWGFHDLGWYEFLYLALVVVPAMLWIDRRPRAPGTFVMVFAALYLPARFGLDFLRIADATYAGLTPAQWAALGLLAIIPLAARAARARPTMP